MSKRLRRLYMTESELIDRCRLGDREAQHVLYARTCERIHGLLLRMTRCSETALDLTQDTYVQAFTRIAQFNGNSSIATWLYRIAVNEALQFMRRKASLRLSSDSVRDIPTNDRENDRSIASIDVGDALSRLDAADQAILLLRYQEGLDYHAIAYAMDCPGGTVASRLNRARDRLRQALRNGYDAPEERVDAVHPINQTGSVRAAQEGSIVPSRLESE